MNYSRVSTGEDGRLADRLVSEAAPAGAGSAMGSGSAAVPSRSQLVRITEDLLLETCEFLHRELNDDISVESWKSQLCYPWLQQKPDYGVALVRPDEGVVGVMVAIYSEQIIDGRLERFANLTHWCVKPAYRRESIRLLMAMKAHKELTMTGFSSTPDAVTIPLRLGWKKLDENAITGTVVNCSIGRPVSASVTLPAIRRSEFRVCS